MVWQKIFVFIIPVCPQRQKYFSLALSKMIVMSNNLKSRKVILN
jgi:hypothetical protein